MALDNSSHRPAGMLPITKARRVIGSVLENLPVMPSIGRVLGVTGVFYTLYTLKARAFSFFSPIFSSFLFNFVSNFGFSSLLLVSEGGFSPCAAGRRRPPKDLIYPLNRE